jgi:hypothetical protein
MSLLIVAIVAVVTTLVIRHFNIKMALQESRCIAAEEKVQAVLEILASDSQHLTAGDLHELQQQVKQEEGRFDANVAEAVGFLGLSAVKAGPLKVYWTQGHGGRC